MTVIVDPIEIEYALVQSTRWKDYVAPESPGRRYFSIEFDHVSYTIVAESSAAAIAMMPGIYRLMHGCPDHQTPDPTFEETLADWGDIEAIEIPGTTTIHDDGRDGLQHPINTFPLGTWASSEY